MLRVEEFRVEGFRRLGFGVRGVSESPMKRKGSGLRADGIGALCAKIILLGSTFKLVVIHRPP